MRIGFSSEGYMMCTEYCRVLCGLVSSLQSYGCLFCEMEAGSPEACLPMPKSSDAAVIQTKETCFDAARQMRRAKLARKR